MKNLVIVVLAGATLLGAYFSFKRVPGKPDVNHAETTNVVATARVPESSSAGGTTGVVVAAPQESALTAELATLRTENARLEKLVRDLQTEVSILNVRRTPAPSLNPDPPAATLPQMPQRILSDLLGNPETVGMAMDWIKADQTQRYASLIALAGLNDADDEELRSLLAERYATRLDVAAAGLESVSVEQRRQLDADFRARLVKLAGEDVTALFEKAEGKPVSFAQMQRFEDRLRYDSAAPLNREQYLPLWNLFSSQVTYSTGMRDASDVEARLQERIAGRNHIARTAGEFLAPEQARVLERMFADEIATARVQAYSAAQALRQRAQRTSAPP